MNYLKKRIRFILIFIFSIAIFALVQWEMKNNPGLTGNRVILVSEILKIFSGGFALYGAVQFFRVK